MSAPSPEVTRVQGFDQDPGAPSGGAPGTLAELFRRASSGDLGEDPGQHRVSVGFVTTQAARHPGRELGYRNELLSLRVGAAVGSCAVEPGVLGAISDLLGECTGATVADLLAHRTSAVRIAALDAYLMHTGRCPGPGSAVASPVEIPAGSSLEKSQSRATAVASLLPPHPGTVLVIGVVNSLLAELRRRGIEYIACDLAGGRTEWGEHVQTDAAAQLEHCDTILATGMTLSNGTFDGLLARSHADHRPLVMFAQTGSAILPWFLTTGVYALSAEPYPFFSLDGGASTLLHYRRETTA